MENANNTTSIFNSPDTYVYPYSTAWLAIVPLTIAFISLVTVIGNLMVIVAFIRDHCIRFKVANLFILNLAITDFIVGAFMWPVNISWLLKDEWVHGEIVCKVWLIVDYSITMMSALTLVMISWNRYCVLSMGIKYQAFQTKKRVGLILFSTWTAVLLWYSFLAFAWTPLTGHKSVDYTYNCELEFTGHLIITLIVNVLQFFIPFTILLSLNIAVYNNIRQRSRGIVGPSPPIVPPVDLPGPGARRLTPDSLKATTSKSISVGLPAEPCPDKYAPSTSLNAPRDPSKTEGWTFARHRKAAVVLGILVGCFLVCWVPIQITSVMFAICGTKCVTYLNWEVTNALVWGNSLINPFIYAATNRHFRRNFRHFLLLDRWGCDMKCSKTKCCS